MKALVPQSVLAWLCHYANADPMGREFYELKERLLRQYAEFMGHDIQEITKECWGDKWDREDGYWYGCSDTCTRCGGTGVFDRRWVRLQKWRWGRFWFHIPDGSTRIKPETVQIVGRVKHQDYGKASREAELWLYLVTMHWRTFWEMLTRQSYCNPGWWPLCRLQKIAMWTRMKLRIHRCWCGRRFMTWGSGWMVCRQCRNRKPSVDEIPF